MRKKLTAFMTNLAELTRLSGLCQDDHEHLEWGQSWEEGKLVFDASREAACPKVLCEKFADILLETARVVTCDFHHRPQPTLMLRWLPGNNLEAGGLHL